MLEYGEKMFQAYARYSTCDTMFNTLTLFQKYM